MFKNLPDDKFIVKTVNTAEKATKLGEIGFEQFMVMQGVQVMRKRK